MGDGGSAGAREDIGPAVADSGVLRGAGRWLTMYGVVASVRLEKGC
jgi:hypothetical protein